MKPSATTNMPSQSVYYGWWVLAATAFTEMLAIGSSSYSAGLFVLPLERELGLSRAAANSALPISFIGAAIFAPLVGWLLDRFPAQRVIAMGAIALGLGFMTIAITSSIPLMVLALLLPAAFGGMAIGPLTTSTLTSRWFYRRRGRALGIATVATSGGGIVVVPLLSWGIENYGWRTALFTEALLIVLIVLTLSTFVVRGNPSELGLGHHFENRGRPAADMVSSRSAHGAGDWRYGRILSTMNFWAIAFVLAVITGLNQAIVVTLVPYGNALGFSPAAAALLITVFSVGAAFVKVTSGFLADFIDRRIILIAATLAMILTLALLLSFSTYPMLLVAAALGGTALGCALPSSAALVAACFGAPSFGRVMGMVYVGIVVSSVVSVAFIGAVFDRTQAYDEAFLIFLAIAVVAALAALLVRAPAKAPQAADWSATSPNIVGSGSPR